MCVPRPLHVNSSAPIGRPSPRPPAATHANPPRRSRRPVRGTERWCRLEEVSNLEGAGLVGGPYLHCRLEPDAWLRVLASTRSAAAGFRGLRHGGIAVKDTSRADQCGSSTTAS
jgi:hypothetical protein